MDRIILTLDQEQTEVIKVLKDLPLGDKERGYKFVYSKKGELIISSTGKKKPNHGDLGGGYDKKDIEAAGWVKFIFDGSKSQVIKVNFTNRSGIYCLPYDSLLKATYFIINSLGSVKVELVDDQNDDCDKQK